MIERRPLFYLFCRGVTVLSPTATAVLIERLKKGYPMTSRLDVINSMLATTGTASLTSEDSQHPSFKIADRVLDEALEDLQTQALWFNTQITELTPNAENLVVVPSNALSCDPVDVTLRFVIRGQYLFDTENNTNQILEAVKCRIIVAVDFEDLPPDAIQFVRANARYKYFLDVDGGEKKLQHYLGKVRTSNDRLIATNMKHNDTNFFLGAHYRNFRTRRSHGSLFLPGRH